MKSPFLQSATAGSFQELNYKKVNSGPVEIHTVVDRKWQGRNNQDTLRSQHTRMAGLYLKIGFAIVLVAGILLVGLLPVWKAHWLQSILLMFGGFVVWTFLEYVIHRFFVHGLSRPHKDVKERSFSICGRHPRGSIRFKILILLLVLILIAATFNQHLFIIAGVAGGWLDYCYMRVFAQWKGMKKFMPGLHRQHLYHMAGGHDKGYGWTTSVWDIFFDTYVPMGYVYAPACNKSLD